MNIGDIITDYSSVPENLRNSEDTRAMYTPSGDIILGISCPFVRILRSTCYICAQMIMPELLEMNILLVEPVFPNLVERCFNDKNHYGWLNNQIPLFDPL
eukprot:NODE_8_length_47770_cov_0.334354.p27 type:complete len:100 gc:universal NODE_8_length_47770_cov_0.334354:23595-23894(+)